MSSIIQTTAQFPLSYPEQCSVSPGMSFLEIPTHWSSCALKRKRTLTALGRKRQNYRSRGLQEPSQGLGLCLRNKAEDIRKAEGERRKVDFFLFGSNQIHSSYQKYISNQKTVLHYRCESWKEWLQVDFWSVINCCSQQKCSLIQASKIWAVCKAFLNSLETYQAIATHTTLRANKCSLELSDALMEWLAHSAF